MKFTSSHPDRAWCSTAHVELTYDHFLALISFRLFCWGVLTTTHGLDVAMSVSVNHGVFYVVYRSLQIEKTNVYSQVGSSDSSPL